jgi:type I site-specific restriction endonuclease
MTPAQIKALIALLLLIGVVAGAYFGVSAYNDAIEDNALLTQQVKQHEQTAKEQKDIIARLQADVQVNAAAVETKEQERKAYADLLATTIKEYRRDLTKITEADRACARRTVPAPVDRLLAD